MSRPREHDDHRLWRDTERDVEREECVRLLVSEGADINVADKGACFVA